MSGSTHGGQSPSASEVFRAEQQRMDELRTAVAASPGGSPLAADVADLTAHASSSSGYGAYVSDTIETAKTQDDFRDLADNTNWYLKQNAAELSAKEARIRSTHQLEISAAASYHAAGALSDLAGSLDTHITAQRDALINSQVKLTSLSGRAQSLGLGLRHEPDPSGALAHLVTTRDRAASLATNTLQVTADFFGVDLRSAQGIATIDLQSQRLMSGFNALIALHETSAFLGGVKEHFTALHSFANGRVQAFDDKYSTPIIGYYNRMGDRFIEGMGPGWLRTTAAVFGNFYGGAADSLVGTLSAIPKLGIGAYNLTSTVARNVVTHGDPFHKMSWGDATQPAESIAKGLWHQVEDLNPANAFNGKHGDSWEDRLSGYSRNIGQAAPDVAATAVTGGFGGISKTVTLARTSGSVGKFVTNAAGEFAAPRLTTMSKVADELTDVTRLARVSDSVSDFLDLVKHPNHLPTVKPVVKESIKPTAIADRVTSYEQAYEQGLSC